MAGNHQHPDGKNGSTVASNVVHLRPRQWLESEDELVPIGGATTEASGDDAPANPASTESTASERRGHASTWLGDGEETVPFAREPAAQAGAAPRAASDFWGEDAAQVHDALEAPVTAPSGSEDERPHESPRFASPRRLLRAPALAAITIAAAAVFAVVINGFGSAPAAHRPSGPAASLHASAGARSPAASARAQATATTAARLRMTAATTRHRVANRAHVRTHPRSRSVRARTRGDHRGTGAVPTVVVRYVTRPPVTAPAATTYTTNAPQQSTSAGYSGPAGPTGTKSLIGAGTSSSG